jgi:hypothetical protein
MYYIVRGKQHTARKMTMRTRRKGRHLEFPPVLYEGIESIRDGRPVAYVIREAITEYLERRGVHVSQTPATKDLSGQAQLFEE